MQVIVTRPAAEAAAWVEGLRARGFDAVALPLIAIGPPADPQAVEQAWSGLASCRAAMFVSANAVRGFFSLGRAWPAQPRAWATGPGTRDALLRAGVPATHVDAPAADAAQFDSETLWRSVEGQCGPGDRVLLVRGGGGREWLEHVLRQLGVTVDTVHAYSRNVPAWSDAQRSLAQGASHAAWLFSSSQAVANLAELVPRAQWAHAHAVVTHARIAQAARAVGFGVVRESRPALDDVIAALESPG